MSYRPFFIYGDFATEPPETDPAPVPCSECGRTDCDCGDTDDSGRDDAMEKDHRRRGGEG